jgi:hypothetical protein
VIGRSTWECIGADVQSGPRPCVVVLKGYQQPENTYGPAGEALAALRMLLTNLVAIRLRLYSYLFFSRRPYLRFG